MRTGVAGMDGCGRGWVPTDRETCGSIGLVGSTDTKGLSVSAEGRRQGFFATDASVVGVGSASALSKIPLRSTGPWYNSSNGGTAFGTPWALNAQGTGGGPKIKWPKGVKYISINSAV